MGWIFTFRGDKIEAVKAYPSYGDALRAATARSRIRFRLRRLNAKSRGANLPGEPFGTGRHGISLRRPANRPEEDQLHRKLIVGLGTAVAALAVAGAAYAAVNVTFSATVSPNKANKPTGAVGGHQVQTTRRAAAADHEPHRDQVRQGREVRREQVQAL